MIRVENLTKAFPPAGGVWRLLNPGRADGHEVLRGVSFEVKKGEIFGLLGPNGGGKTTLLEILATYLLPTGGRAWIDGHDIVEETGAVRRLIGYCPAGASGFYPQLTGRQNLEFFAILLGGAPVDPVWERAGLGKFRDVRVSRYSDGMRQRLALARALLGDPPVLLLDEPTRALDPEAAAGWRRAIRALGKTVLLVTHNPAEADEVCDRKAVLREGVLGE